MSRSGQPGERRLRICVFGERLAPPPDEGIKKLTLSLASALKSLGHEVLTLTTGAGDWPEAEVYAVNVDRLLRSRDLAERLTMFKPDAVVYVPTASLTLASGLRSRTLKHYARSPVALVATQGRRHGRLVRWAGRLAGPDLCAAQSAATISQARRLGWRTAQLPPGVDLATFRPASATRKRALRRQFGLPEEAFIVLHAGHLNRSRGITDLVALADIALPLLVASTSTKHDEALSAELRGAGVTVLAEFIPNIADAYSACDAYVFPVPPDPLAPSSIDVPLSVLEAAACNLPIVTTRFGALPELWPDAGGVSFYNDRAGLRAALQRLQGQKADPCGTRALAELFGWDVVADKLLRALLGGERRA